MTIHPNTAETDPAEAERARHAGLLQELQDLGMRVARAAAIRAEAAESEGECGAAALALGRAGKLVRQCIALERDLRRTMAQDARAAGNTQEDPAAEKEAADALNRNYWRMLWGRYGRGLVRDSITRLIDAEDRAPGERERLLSDLKDRLDARDETVDDRFGIGGELETFADAMGLGIDWSLFDGHGWAAEYDGVLSGRRLKQQLRAASARARPPP